jgi:membrane associated rhomboid family serine protease
MLLPVHDRNNTEVTVKPIISYIIIALCLLVFTYQAIISAGSGINKQVGIVKLANFNQKFGFVPARYFNNETSFQLQEIDKVNKVIQQMSPNSEHAMTLTLLRTVYTTPLLLKLTPIFFCFLHGNLWHLLSNLWFFWIFSDNVEERLGTIAFAIFYVLVGALSGLGHGLLNSSSVIPLIGASGAISGVMGAYMVFFPKNLITSFFCPIWFYIRKVEVPAFVVLGFYILINLFQATKVSTSGVNVAFDCHIIGFISGVVLAFGYKLLVPDTKVGRF